jgi:hypothetical protein
VDRGLNLERMILLFENYASTVLASTIDLTDKGVSDRSFAKEDWIESQGSETS